MRSADRPEIEFEVVCDVIESVNFDKFHGSFDVTSNFKLDFRVIGSLHKDAEDFSSLFFEFFLVTTSIKIGQVPPNL